jgi:hypothetical protein
MTETPSATRLLLKRVRLLVALAALVGVLAMHGFSADHAIAGPTMTAVPGWVQTGTADPVTDAGMTHEHDAEAMPTVRVDAVAVAGRSDCPMSHSDCLATLRSAPHGKYPVGSGLPVPAAPAHSQLTTAPTLALSAGRSPPDVSLTGLCISRT